MSINKLKELQGKITKKFKVYTSLSYSQGLIGGKPYTNIDIYDEIHGFRYPKTFVAAIEDLEKHLAMTEKQFKYESAKEKLKEDILSKHEEIESLKDEIASLEDEL